MNHISGEGTPESKITEFKGKEKEKGAERREDEKADNLARPIKGHADVPGSQLKKSSQRIKGSQVPEGEIIGRISRVQHQLIDLETPGMDNLERFRQIEAGIGKLEGMKFVGQERFDELIFDCSKELYKFKKSLPNDVDPEMKAGIVALEAKLKDYGKNLPKIDKLVEAYKANPNEFKDPLELGLRQNVIAILERHPIWKEIERDTKLFEVDEYQMRNIYAKRFTQAERALSYSVVTAIEETWEKVKNDIQGWQRVTSEDIEGNKAFFYGKYISESEKDLWIQSQYITQGGNNAIYKLINLFEPRRYVLRQPIDSKLEVQPAYQTEEAGKGKEKVKREKEFIGSIEIQDIKPSNKYQRNGVARSSREDDDNNAEGEKVTEDTGSTVIHVIKSDEDSAEGVNVKEENEEYKGSTIIHEIGKKNKKSKSSSSEEEVPEEKEKTKVTVKMEKVAIRKGSTIIYEMVEKSKGSKSSSSESEVLPYEFRDDESVSKGEKEDVKPQRTVKEEQVERPREKQISQEILVQETLRQLEDREGLCLFYKIIDINGHKAMVIEEAYYSVRIDDKKIKVNNLDQMTKLANENKLIVRDQIVIMEMIKNALKGVQKAHSKEIIHVDLKPLNILCFNNAGAYGYGRVTDWESAFYKKNVENIEFDQIVGTTTYVAPELAAKIDVTEKSDIFSLGISLFELLSGKPVEEHPAIKVAYDGYLQIKNEKMELLQEKRNIIQDMKNPKNRRILPELRKALSRIDSKLRLIERKIDMVKCRADLVLDPGIRSYYEENYQTPKGTMADLVRRMTSVDPKDRPDIDEVIKVFDDYYKMTSKQLSTGPGRSIEKFQDNFEKLIEIHA